MPRPVPPAVAAPIPVPDLFRHAEQTEFKLSPSGTSIAFLQAWQGHRNIYVRPRSGGPPVRVTSLSDRELEGYYWKGDDDLIYLVDGAGDGDFHIFSIKKDGTDLRDLTPFTKVRAQLIDTLGGSDTEVLVAMNKRTPALMDVFRLDVITGELTQVAENPGSVVQWLADHAGRVRVAVRCDGTDYTILYRTTEQAPWTPVGTTDFRDIRQPIAFTCDDEQLYVVSNIGRDTMALVTFDPETATEREVVFSRPDVDVSLGAWGYGFSHKRKTLTVIDVDGEYPDTHVVDAFTREMLGKVAARLPGQHLRIADCDRAEDAYIIDASSDRKPPQHYLYDVRSNELTKIGDDAPWLDERLTSPMTPFSYQTRDGLTVRGYITVPTGSAGTNLPLVVVPHGGPFTRDGWGYRPDVQFFASRGYAVLTVNYRGSFGYGRKFWEASFKKFGETMNGDLTDGVKHVVGQGIVDPRRVAIFGHSFGGYMALAGLVFSPELYRCGVDYAGMSDLFMFMRSLPAYTHAEDEMYHEMIGDPVKDKAMLEAASPAFHVDRIKAPLLIAQGANDPIVTIAETNQLVAACEKHGVDVQYVVMRDEGHFFRSESSRLTLFTAIESFLAANMK